MLPTSPEDTSPEALAAVRLIAATVASDEAAARMARHAMEAILALIPQHPSR